MKYFLSALVVCITVYLCLSIQFQKNDVGKAFINLANIEALANEGENEEVKVKCRYLGSLDCPNSIEKVKYIH
jgi:hypothetical protein